jgi:hypothetical protein
MFQHDWLAAQLAQDHRRDLLHQAEQERLARQVKSQRTTRGHAFYHALDWTGRRLVTVGDQLQARHAAVHARSLLHTSRG